MRMKAFAASAGLALLVAGCNTTGPASVEGLKAVFPPPPHAVRAQTRTGQRWVDKTIESHVALGRKRPPPHPDDARSRNAFAPAVRAVRPQKRQRRPTAAEMMRER